MFLKNPFFDADSAVAPLTRSDATLFWSVVAVICGVLIARFVLEELPFRRPRRPRAGAPRFRPAARRPQPLQGKVQRLHAVTKVPEDLVHDHLAAVAQSGFERCRLLNRSEARLLPAIEAAAARLGAGHRVMAQVCLGEVLRPLQQEGTDASRRAAFNAINAKRLDFAVFDRGGWLVLAIEYQGRGHYHAISFLRDAVKREVLRKAGVPLLELPADISPDALQLLVAETLGARSDRMPGPLASAARDA